MAEDYYKILGVEKKATKADIKKAYKKLAMKHHPDRNKGNKQSEETFKKINEAYAVLSDDDKRRQYDQFGAEGFSNRFSQEDIFKGFNFGSIIEEFDLGEDIFSTLFGGGGNKSGRGSPFSFDFGGGSFGRGQSSGRGGASPKGGDAEMELRLTLEEAVMGGKKTISFDAGGGMDRIVITIPAGIEEGKKLKVKGKGTANPMTGKRGDLFCKIVIAPHKEFKREGKDLVLEKEIRLTELILGGSVSVSTLDEKKIELKIPPLTKNNSLMRVKGKGVPGTRGKAGNLLIRLSARLPDELTEKQKELIEELSKEGL